MREVFKRIISSIQNSPHEWTDDHRPKGHILSHKSGITVYAYPGSMMTGPANIKATWREGWMLTNVMRCHSGNTRTITDDEIIEMLE